MLVAEVFFFFVGELYSKESPTSHIEMYKQWSFSN